MRKTSILVLLLLAMFLNKSMSQSITITSPNGGEQFSVGETVNVTWTSTGVALAVLSYATTGSNWEIISSSVNAMSGTYTWTIPDINSSTVTIGIADMANLSTVNDESDAPFSILPATMASIEVTSPNGGESWAVGSQQTITWTTTGIDDNQELEVRLSRDGGANYYILMDGSVSYLNGSYTWTVNGDPSDNCFIKVRTNNVEDINDVSDDNFAITGGTTTTPVITTSVDTVDFGIITAGGKGNTRTFLQ